MKVLVLTLVLASLSSISAFADVLPSDCVTRIQAVAALIPGDDGTFSQPGDVQISNVKLVDSGTGGATGVPYSTYSVDLSVVGFTGSAVLNDSAGSCYIYNFSMKAP